MEKKMSVVFDGRMRVFCLVLTAFAATAARADVQIGRLYDVVVVLENAEVSVVTRTADGWDTGFAVGRQVVDATGNATVAALAGARRCDPREVPLGDIKAKLSEIGHIVPVR